MFQKVLLLCETTKAKFEFMTVLNPAGKVRKEIVGSASSAGLTNWSYPLANQLDWDNSLVGIVSNEAKEFNFLFKNGSQSHLTMSSPSQKSIDKIHPAESKVHKIVVKY